MDRKHCGKRRNCLLRAISPFPIVFSKGLFPRGVKRCHHVGMGSPDMPILGSSNSTANKDMMSKNYGQIGIKLCDSVETLWKKEKLLVMSNFSLSNNAGSKEFQNSYSSACHFALVLQLDKER